MPLCFTRLWDKVHEKKGLRLAGFILFFHARRFILKPVDSLSARLYMRINLRILRLAGVKLDRVLRYISTGVKFGHLSLASLGERAVISERVILLTHDYSLTALIALGKTPNGDLAVRRGISIGKNVFVGMVEMLMPGREIGDNVIIGVGSVVRGRVPRDSVVIGNPAEVIGNVRELGERWRSRLGSNFVTSDDNQATL